MIRGICNKCNTLIEIDETTNALECPNCHEQIFTDTAIKNYQRAIMAYKRKAEIAMMGSTDYEKAYENYKMLLNLNNTDLGILMSNVYSKIYCSTMHKIRIKEATDILLKNSENVEIGKENVVLLSDSLARARLECRKIVDAFNKVSNQSNYSLNLYKTSLEEYKYYLNAYVSIYDALKDLSVYFKESRDVINEELSFINNELKRKIDVKNIDSSKHDFIDEKNQVYENIFPNKHKLYKVRMILYGVMGIGAVLSIVGLILLSINVAPAVKFSILGIGLAFFIGGYFVNHKLKSKNYNLDY